MMSGGTEVYQWMIGCSLTSNFLKAHEEISGRLSFRVGRDLYIGFLNN